VPSIPDEVLMTRMQARDQEALSSLFDRFRGVVFSLALRIVRDRAEAEEILTDVFLQAWRQAGGFDRHRPSARPRAPRHGSRRPDTRRTRGG